MKIKTMTIPEFLEINRNKKIDIISIRTNKKLETMFAFVLGGFMYVQNVYAVDTTSKIDKGGLVILGVCRQIGYWACLIMCSIEIIKSLMSGDTKGITKIISKYVVGFGALYFLPWIFDLIKSIFA